MLLYVTRLKRVLTPLLIRLQPRDYNSLINHITNCDYHWWLKTGVFLTLIIRLPVYNSKIELTLIIINDTIITFLTT